MWFTGHDAPCSFPNPKYRLKSKQQYNVEKLILFLSLFKRVFISLVNKHIPFFNPLTSTTQKASVPHSNSIYVTEKSYHALKMNNSIKAFK